MRTISETINISVLIFDRMSKIKWRKKLFIPTTPEGVETSLTSRNTFASPIAVKICLCRLMGRWDIAIICDGKTAFLRRIDKLSPCSIDGQEIKTGQIVPLECQVTLNKLVFYTIPG